MKHRKNFYLVIITIIVSMMMFNSCSYKNNESTNNQNSNEKLVVLTIEVDGQGTISGSKSGSYKPGSKISLVATPQKTEYGESVFLYYKSISGKVLSKNKNYSFAINDNTAIIACFKTPQKEAPLYDQILEKITAESINKLYDHKRVEDPLGFSDHKEYYYTQVCKVTNGIIYETPWYSDAVEISLKLEQIDKTTVSKSVTTSVSAGLGITLFDVLSFDIAENQRATTITEITEQTKSISHEAIWNLKEFSNEYKYKIVVIGDYYINKELYIWDGFLLIGHDETISYFMELINTTDVFLVKEKKG